MNKFKNKQIEYINGNTVTRHQEKQYDIETQQEIERIRKVKKDRYLREKARKNQIKKNMSQIVLGVFLSGCVVIYGDNKVYSAQRQVKDLKNQIASLKSDNENMKVQILKVSSIDQIKDISENKLKMISPTHQNQIFVDISKNNFSPKVEKSKDNNGSIIETIKNFMGL